MKRKKQIKDYKAILADVQNIETMVNDRLEDLEVTVGRKLDRLEG